MKKILYVGGPFPSSIPKGLTYLPEAPVPQDTEDCTVHLDEFDRVAREIQPVAMCYIGASLVTTDWKDIDILVLLPDEFDLDEVEVPEGYRRTSPPREAHLEDSVDYPDTFRCFRKGIYNLILTTDSGMFNNFRRASLLMTTLADTDDLLRVAFNSKESRVNLYKTIGIIDA